MGKDDVDRLKVSVVGPLKKTWTALTKLPADRKVLTMNASGSCFKTMSVGKEVCQDYLRAWALKWNYVLQRSAKYCTDLLPNSEGESKSIQTNYENHVSQELAKLDAKHLNNKRYKRSDFVALFEVPVALHGCLDSEVNVGWEEGVDGTKEEVEHS